MTKVKEISGEIKLSDGSVTKFRIDKSYGWSQWGNVTENLAVTVALLESFAKLLVEE
jgi:hypothetical protein